MSTKQRVRDEREAEACALRAPGALVCWNRERRRKPFGGLGVKHCPIDHSSAARATVNNPSPAIRQAGVHAHVLAKREIAAWSQAETALDHRQNLIEGRSLTPALEALQHAIDLRGSTVKPAWQMHRLEAGSDLLHLADPAP